MIYDMAGFVLWFFHGVACRCRSVVKQQYGWTFFWVARIVSSNSSSVRVGELVALGFLMDRRICRQDEWEERGWGFIVDLVGRSDRWCLSAFHIWTTILPISEKGCSFVIIICRDWRRAVLCCHGRFGVATGLLSLSGDAGFSILAELGGSFVFTNKSKRSPSTPPSRE